MMSSQEMAPTTKTNARQGEVSAEAGSTDSCRLRIVTGLILNVQQEGGKEMRQQQRQNERHTGSVVSADIR
jgi:hypothetical protein